VIKTGSPLMEVLKFYNSKIEQSDVLERLDLNEQKYFLVSLHREENVEPEDQLIKLVNILNSLSEKFNLPIIVSTHPRTQKRLDVKKFIFNPKITFLKPFGFFDYIKLQQNAKVVLSDSGTITEEASILNFPALNIREAHERPEGMEEASVMMVGLEWDLIQQALHILEKQPRGNERLLSIVKDYNVPNVSDKVIRIILSYTNYVKRNVWKSLNKV